MKKSLIFILGLITGVVLTFVASFLFTSFSAKENHDLVIFDEPTQIMSQTSFKVIQTLENGTALAEDNSNGLFTTSDLVVLLKSTDNSSYYDEQIVSTYEGYRFVQVGVFSYFNNSGIKKTVPVVSLLDQ